MSTPTPTRAVTTQIGFAPLGIRVGFLALAIAEVVLLTLRFDGKTMSPDRTWGFRVLKELPTLARLGVVGLAIPSILMIARPNGAVASRTRSEGLSRSFPCFLVGHVCGYAGFYLLSLLIFESNTRLAAAPALVAGVWLGLGSAWIGCWLALVVPPGLWPKAARSGLVLPMVGVVAAVATGLATSTHRLWDTLGFATFWGVHGVLSRFLPEVVCRPEAAILGTPRFAVRISPECSGYEGMVLIAILLCVYLWWARRDLRLGRSLFLIPLGVAAAWLANLARIAVLIWLGDRVSPRVALGGFHSQAGWLLFNAVALGIVALTQHTTWFHSAPRRREEVGAEAREADPTVAYLAPQMAILAAMMVAGALSSGFDWGYPLRLLAVAPVFWAFRRTYRKLVGPWSWGAAGIGILMFAAWMLLEPRPAGRAGPSALLIGLSRLPTWVAGLWVAARVVGSVVAVPIAEELAFRGYALRRLISSDFASVSPGRFTWLSFLGSSALFGSLHGRWLAGTLAGMLYAAAAYRRGRLSDAMLAHAVTNGLIAMTVLSDGAWSLWS